MQFDWQPTLEAVDADTATGAVVPESLRGLYKNVDGKFNLVEEAKKRLGDVSGLNTALDKERKLNKTVKEAAEKWARLGASPEEVEQKITELTEAATKDGKVNLDKLKADLEKGFKTQLDGKDTEIKAKDAALGKYLIESAAVTALNAAKGSAVLLLPHIKGSVKVVENNGEYVVRVLDADGDARGDGKGGFMTVADLVAEMKASTEFSRAFEASGGTGGGTPPGRKAGGGAGGGIARDKMSATQKISAGLDKNQIRR